MKRLRSVRHDVALSMKDGCAYSIMVGLGETYFPAFVLAVGLSQVSAGLISTVPLLVGALIQLIVPFMVHQLGSYRRWIVWAATVQAFVFIPLVVGAIFGTIPLTAMFLVVGSYWAAGMAITPSWYCWTSSIIPAPIRTSFFAKRNRLCQIFALLGFLGGGIMLQMLPKGGVRSYAFGGLFFVAFLARYYSVYCISQMSEPSPPKCDRSQKFKGWKMYGWERSTPTEGKRLLFYMLAVQMATYIASPFFNSYMLGELKLTYANYAILIAASFLAKALLLPWLGRIAQTRGPLTLLWLGGVGLVTNPILWLFSSQMPYLIFIQGLSGFFWAAYELASLLLIMEKVDERDRIVMMTTYNLGYAIVITIASLIGGSLLEMLGPSGRGYVALFTISAFARALTLIPLARLTPHPVRTVLIPIRRLSLLPFNTFLDFLARRQAPSSFGALPEKPEEVEIPLRKAG